MRLPRIRGIWMLALICILGCKQGSMPDLHAAMPFLADVIPPGDGTLFRGSFSPDGTEFYYFRKIALREEDYRIYRIKQGTDGWSTPVMIVLGDSSHSDMYPAISPDGQLMVFTSYRKASEGTSNANLWASRRIGDGWDTPFLLGVSSTLENYDASPWFGPEGNLRFTSTSPDWSTMWFRKATLVNHVFAPWQDDTSWAALNIPAETHHFWSGVMNRAGTIAVVELSPRQADGSLGDSDLWVSYRNAEEWSSPKLFGPDVNTDATENFPSFAPDDSTLVFVQGFSRFLRVNASQR